MWVHACVPAKVCVWWWAVYYVCASACVPVRVSVRVQVRAHVCSSSTSSSTSSSQHGVCVRERAA